MTRGRPLTTALDAALHIARHRGTAMRFSPGPENFAHVVIRSPGRIIFVWIRYASRIHTTPAETGVEYREPLTRLRSVPGTGPVARELWLYSRYGSWRYFLVGDTGIEEVSATGEAVISVKKPKAARSPPKTALPAGGQPADGGAGKVSG